MQKQHVDPIQRFGAFSGSSLLRKAAIAATGLSLSSSAMAARSQPSGGEDPLSQPSQQTLNSIDLSEKPIIPSTLLGEWRYQENRDGRTPLVYRMVGVYGTNIPGRNVHEALWALDTEERDGVETRMLEPFTQGGVTYFSIRSWIGAPFSYMAEPLNAIVVGGDKAASKQRQAEISEGMAKPLVEQWPVIIAVLELKHASTGERLAISPPERTPWSA